FDIVKVGVYASYFLDPDHLSEAGRFNGKLGLLFTPVFFKLGLVFENTTLDDSLAFLLRTQLGYRFKIIKISAGFSRILVKNQSFVFNAGFELQPLDWFGFVANFEAMQISGGIYFSSRRTTLYIGSLYNPLTN